MFYRCLQAPGVVRFLAAGWLLMVFSAGCCAPVFGAMLEHYRYRQTTGDSVQRLDWKLEEDAPFRLVAEIGAERDVTRVNERLATTSWEVIDAKADTHLNVWREGDSLRIEGRFQGKPIREDREIDSAPWYQALSVSLRPLIDGAREKPEFWCLRPDTLEMHKLRVTSREEEDFDLRGTKIRSVKLEIRLAGFRSMFWKCQYWLRKSDGLFLKYEGPSGPPGWPLTRVTLAEHSAAPD